MHAGSQLSSVLFLAACCNVSSACDREGRCSERQGRASLAVVGAMLQREQMRGIWLDMNRQDADAGGSGLAPRDLLARLTRPDATRQQARSFWARLCRVFVKVRNYAAISGTGSGKKRALTLEQNSWQNFDSLEAFVSDNFGLPPIESYLSSDNTDPLINTSYIAAAADAAKRQQNGLAPTTLERLTRFVEYAMAASTFGLYYADIGLDLMVLHSFYNPDDPPNHHPIFMSMSMSFIALGVIIACSFDVGERGDVAWWKIPGLTVVIELAYGCHTLIRLFWPRINKSHSYEEDWWI